MHKRAWVTAAFVLFIAASFAASSPVTVRAQRLGLSTVSAIETLVAPRRPAALERRVFDRVNEVRVAHGLPPIPWNDEAAAVARYHSDDMAARGYFAHLDPDGKLPGERANALGLTDWKTIGENIAWNRGFDDPVARVVEAWMLSPGHRENILRRKWKETGIGITVTPDGRIYFTQVFLKRR